MTRLFLLCGMLVLTTSWSRAAEAPSYSKQIQPLFAKYCLECHNSKRPRAGLDLETPKGLQAGSDNGSVYVPGKADKSKLVLVVEGKQKPVMPPKKTEAQPKPQEIALLRQWVETGAKFDKLITNVVLPEIQTQVKRWPPVAALAYTPNGKWLFAGTYNQVQIIQPDSGKLQGTYDLPEPATALAVNSAGTELAVAAGVSGTNSSLFLYSISPSGNLGKPLVIQPAHEDLVQSLHYSKDGNTLVTCGYDRRVKIWEANSGKKLQMLKEHSDSVYSLDFHPGGTLMATGAADRAVKVWGTNPIKLRYTLGESTDWVYAVAWSPDGKHIAAGGVDKSIRVWRANRNQGNIVHSVFAHQAPITHLAYSPDGKILYSVSEDRTFKAWDSYRMVEKKVFAQQPEAIYSFAIHPQKAQLALGRFDGTLLLLDANTGKVQSQPIPAKPKPPQVNSISPQHGPRGKKVNLTFTGKNLRGTIVKSNQPGLKVKIASQKSSKIMNAIVLFPANTSPGEYQLWLENSAGKSKPRTFTVDVSSAKSEMEPNNSPGNGQPMKLPATITGVIQKAGDVDFVRFQAKREQQLGVQVIVAKNKSKATMIPVLELVAGNGKLLAHSEQGYLGFQFQSDGTYSLGIRDRDFGGNGSMKYRLQLGRIPVLKSIFPLGLQQGNKTKIYIQGVHLGSKDFVEVQANIKAQPGSKLPVPIQSPYGKSLGARQVVVGEFPEVLEQSGTIEEIPTPGTANGRISEEGENDYWKFRGKKGEQLIVEVNARRLGSRLDSFIEILDANGNPVPRATLRSLAKTYVTFRDHDSAKPGIRIEAWSELAMNDYIYTGTQLLRIRDLPTHPDSDCQFWSLRGQRLGYLGTTPTELAKGEPMYKVAIHPPGTNFPPNGFPVIHLRYRNDDGGPGFGRDSRIFFDPPSDGQYQIRIGDSRNYGGEDFAYRLTVRRPRPSFNVRFSPTNPAVYKGGAIPITVNVDRIDGFQGKISVRLENVPTGLSAPETFIPEEETSTAFALWAEPDAKTPKKAPPLRLVATARINGKLVRREVSGGLPKVIKPGDIRTTTEQSIISIQPGGKTHLTVYIERAKGFKGRVPIDIKGLPHGVKVLDIGLNGILITEKEKTRTMEIHCEPWVQPMDHPIVVSARREGRNTQHAAKSVLLRVRK